MIENRYPRIENAATPHRQSVAFLMQFHKYHALGNDYLVLELDAALLDAARVRRICHRHYGAGSDGILVGERQGAGFRLRIFNPDGSEAEKSGNGLRIYARYLFDTAQVQGESFTVHTQGGEVTCQVRDAGRMVFVAMGHASFDSERIPVVGSKREVIGEPLEIAGERVVFTAVTVGNPHCVIHVPEVSAATTQRLGPLIERHPLFPNATNVQFVKVLDRNRIQIEIWERGAGYTLASGSSSCAAAAASVKLGHCAGNVTVAMPGGTLEIGVGKDFSLTMLGPVCKVATGTLSPECLEAL
jgi:diaminopimelate epimerase